MGVGVSIAFLAAALAFLALVFLNPALFWLARRFVRERPVRRGNGQPNVDLIVVARNAAGLIGDKIRNALALDYPRDKLGVIVYSDGSTDGTAAEAEALASARVRVIAAPEHRGKIAGLNAAAAASRADVLVFTDVDALLNADALALLLPALADPDVGGVCGRKVLRGRGGLLGIGQQAYNAFADVIKRQESRIGSVSASDGTLYAIRRSLFRPVPPGVTDDLYVHLNVIRQGRRFLYEPRAQAVLPPPSTSSGHEISRRRRIVAGSLHGLYLMRETLNPLRYGSVALSLILNKVLRRLLPVFAALVFGASWSLAGRSRTAAAFFALQALFYLAAVLPFVLPRRAAEGSRLAGLFSLPHFILIGLIGTLCGVADFLRGRRTVKWEPRG